MDLNCLAFCKAYCLGWMRRLNNHIGLSSLCQRPQVLVNISVFFFFLTHRSVTSPGLHCSKKSHQFCDRVTHCNIHNDSPVPAAPAIRLCGGTTWSLCHCAHTSQAHCPELETPLNTHRLINPPFSISHWLQVWLISPRQVKKISWFLRAGTHLRGSVLPCGTGPERKQGQRYFQCSFLFYRLGLTFSF